jgi:hypothetical protein
MLKAGLQCLERAEVTCGKISGPMFALEEESVVEEEVDNEGSIPRSSVCMKPKAIEFGFMVDEPWPKGNANMSTEELECEFRDCMPSSAWNRLSVMVKWVERDVSHSRCS